MKINLNIEEDAELRAYIKDLIAGQVKSILREDFVDILKSNSMEIVSKNLTNLYVCSVIKDKVHDEICKIRGSNTVNFIKDVAREEIIKAVRERVGEAKISDLFR